MPIDAQALLKRTLIKLTAEKAAIEFASFDIRIEYRVNPNAPNAETPGATMRQHEKLHVTEYADWCRDIDQRIKSEGFVSKGSCEANRQAFDRGGFYRDYVRFSDEANWRVDHHGRR